LVVWIVDPDRAGDFPARFEETKMTPLREQMTNAMRLRGFAARTQEACCAAVGALARHYHCSPDTLNAEQLQSYLLHLITEKKQAYASVNQASCAFRFLYGTVLRWSEVRLDIPMAKVPRRLPQILSREEVARLIEAGTTLYASGGDLQRAHPGHGR